MYCDVQLVPRNVDLVQGGPSMLLGSGIAVRLPFFCAMHRRNIGSQCRLNTTCLARARLASETILSRSAKRYVSPFQAERAKQATIRALKAKGEWPNPKPPVVVIPGTRRSGAKKADLRAVADLDAFDPRAPR